MNTSSISKPGYSLSLQRATLIAGIAYLIAIFVTPYSWINPLIIIGDAANPLGFIVTVAAPAFFSEFMLTLWLLIKGSRLKEGIK